MLVVIIHISRHFISISDDLHDFLLGINKLYVLNDYSYSMHVF